jgi:hypothetical protein
MCFLRDDTPGCGWHQVSLVMSRVFCSNPHAKHFFLLKHMVDFFPHLHGPHQRKLPVHVQRSMPELGAMAPEAATVTLCRLRHRACCTSRRNWLD